MRRPPRPVDERVLNGQTVVLALLQGAGVLLVAVGVLAHAISRGMPTQDVRALTFVTLVVADLGLILANRAGSALRSYNPALWTIRAGATALLVTVIIIPSLRQLFGFGVLGVDDVSEVVVASLLALSWLGALRWLGRRLNMREPSPLA